MIDMIPNIVGVFMFAIATASTVAAALATVGVLLNLCDGKPMRFNRDQCVAMVAVQIMLLGSATWFWAVGTWLMR